MLTLCYATLILLFVLKGRDVGKAVRHCPNLEIEDTDLTQYFTILNNILSDPGFMAINKSTNNAKQKLTQVSI